MTGRTPEEYVDHISEFERMEFEFESQNPRTEGRCPNCEEVTTFNKSFADSAGVCTQCGKDACELNAIMEMKK